MRGLLIIEINPLANKIGVVIKGAVIIRVVTCRFSSKLKNTGLSSIFVIVNLSVFKFLN